jgi:uncharacterized membrane protein YdfJ with MMPL/SSD domain
MTATVRAKPASTGLAIPQLMIRLAGVARRRRWILIGVWVVLVAGSIPFSIKSGDHLSAAISGVSGSQSNAVTAALASGQFGQLGLQPIDAVVVPQSGAGAADRSDAVTRLENGVKATPKVVLSSSAASTATKEAESSNNPFVVPLEIDASPSAAVTTTQDLVDAIDSGATRTMVTEYVTGESAVQAAQVQEANSSAHSASTVSLGVMLILLLIAFGALVAALVPLILGAAAITITGMAIFFISEALTISIFATSLASMIGLAVAVDYSLFILMRYREELAGGASREALLVQMAFMPSVIILLGDRVWWLPRWLDRLLPEAGVE